VIGHAPASVSGGQRVHPLTVGVKRFSFFFLKKAAKFKMHLKFKVLKFKTI